MASRYDGQGSVGVLRRELSLSLRLLALVVIFLPLPGCVFSLTLGFGEEETTDSTTNIEQEESSRPDVDYRVTATDEEVAITFFQGRQCRQREVTSKRHVRTRTFNHVVPLVELTASSLALVQFSLLRDRSSAVFDNLTAGAGLYALFTLPAFLISSEKESAHETRDTTDWETIPCESSPVRDAAVFVDLAERRVLAGETDHDGRVSIPLERLEDAYVEQSGDGEPLLRTELHPPRSPSRLMSQMVVPDEVAQHLIELRARRQEERAAENEKKEAPNSAPQSP